jgi:hypothetical protein
MAGSRLVEAESRYISQVKKTVYTNVSKDKTLLPYSQASFVIS